MDSEGTVVFIKSICYFNVGMFHKVCTMVYLFLLLQSRRVLFSKKQYNRVHLLEVS